MAARSLLMPLSMTLPFGGILIGCLAGLLWFQCRATKSLVYDLFTGRGVVSSRAASILRSVETLPSIG